MIALFSCVAQLPQEKGGIQIPPDVTSVRKYHQHDSDNVNGSVSTIESAYRNYVDVLISEALVLCFVHPLIIHRD